MFMHFVVSYNATTFIRIICVKLKDTAQCLVGGVIYMYSLIIYEIVNFSFFALYSLLLLSFFLYLKSVPIHVIVHGM